MEKDPCGGGGYILNCFMLSSLPCFFTFLPFCYPYILLHFKCFLLRVFITAQSHKALTGLA